MITSLINSFGVKTAIVLALCSGLAGTASAQAPTSLSYPTPVVYVTNVSNVYLAPSVAGNVDHYSILPTLPAGLAIDSNTGIITGIPTVAIAATNYTVSATGGSPSGSTTCTLNLTVTSNYFNNAYQNINFGGTTNGTSVQIINKVGDGKHAGDIVLYRNVAYLSNTYIDAIVTTASITNDTLISYDETSTANATYGFSGNDPRFFSPLTFLYGPGNIIFNFKFILGNSYNNATNLGTPVVLQNVQINTYDIDGNGADTSNQFNEFGGFTTSELGSPSTVSAAYDPTTGLTRYNSLIDSNSQVVTAPATRVRVTYNNISNFNIQVGAHAAGLAYFFLDFGAGPTFATATPTNPPTIDLNTSTSGVNNVGSGCGTQLAFTGGSAQTNVASTTALNDMIISYPNASQLPDGSAEQLIIMGGTPAANNTFALNFTANTSSNITVGGVNYTIACTVNGPENVIEFTNGGTFTVAQAEALIDAFKYNNTSGNPTSGDRNFTVNVRNSAFQSPDAVFTATLNCVHISGNIWHDANGLTDNLVNASAASQLTANQAYAVLVSPSDNKIVAVQGISANGPYIFNKITPGSNFAIYISNASVAVNTVFNTPTYPALYQSTGENLGTAAGHDNAVDGKLLVTVGSADITNANFGIQLPPTTTSTAYSNIPNPGGFNNYALPAGAFPTADADGTVSSITITGFSASINYLKVGSVYYTNGGTCPAQAVAAGGCTTWPGTLVVPYTAGVLPAISVDPASDGVTSGTINFTAKDNGAATSNQSTVTVNFIATPGTNFVSIAGNVWDDANANGVKDGIEALVAPANASQTLYAILVQNTNTYSGVPTVYASTAVTAVSGYTFPSVPANSNYEVRIVSLASAPVAGAAASTITPNMATNWTAVSTSNSGAVTTGLNTSNPINAIPSLTADKTNVNFGLEQKPSSDVKSYSVGYNTFSSTPATNFPAVAGYMSLKASSPSLTGYTLGGSLTGSDPEDCSAAGACSIAKMFKIDSINANTKLYYNKTGTTVVQLLAGDTITSFDATKLVIYGAMGSGTGSHPIGYTYSLVDAGGLVSAPAAYSIISVAPLPVVLVSLDARAGEHEITVSWASAVEAGLDKFVVERSINGKDFNAIGDVQAKGSNSTYTYPDLNLADGLYYYRLRMVDYSTTFSYSNVVSARLRSGTGASIGLSPNPATSILKVNGLTTDAQVTIFELSGKIALMQNSVTANTELNIAALPAGVYMVRVLDGSGVPATLRLIKQ